MTKSEMIMQLKQEREGGDRLSLDEWTAAIEILQAVEREACAKIADDRIRGDRSVWGSGYEDACEAIADAIRNRK